MKKTVLLLSSVVLLFTVITFSSCKKDKPTEPESNYSTADYIPLTEGNYWVYEMIQIDTAGNETAITGFDSTIIRGKTTINGETYYEYVGTPQEAGLRRNNAFMRDSASFMINTRGYKYLSTDREKVDLGEYSFIYNNDTVIKCSYQMGDWGKEVSTKAGTFKTISSIGTNTIYAPFDVNGAKKTTFIRFAPKVGIVAERYYLPNTPGYFERRLVRYSVK